MITHSITTTSKENELLVKLPDHDNKEMIIHCTLDQYLEGCRQYNSGEMIQYAFPFLSVEEREFLLTGTTSEEWDAIFGEDF